MVSRTLSGCSSSLLFYLWWWSCWVLATCSWSLRWVLKPQTASGQSYVWSVCQTDEARDCEMLKLNVPHLLEVTRFLTEAYASGFGEGKMRGCLSAHLFDFSSCSRSARLPRILGSFTLHSHVCNTLQPCYKVHVGRDSEVEEGTHPSVRVSAAERLQILVGSVVGDWAGDNVLKHMWAKTYFYSL